MKRTRPTTATRFGGMMMETESLESRRLFAGFGGPHGGFGHGYGGPHWSPQVAAIRQALYTGGGQMDVSNNGSTTTATSTLTIQVVAAGNTPSGNAAAAPRANAVTNDVITVRPTAYVNAPVAIPVRTDGDAGTIVCQVETAAAPAVATAALAGPSATVDGVGGAVFGPFAVSYTTDTGIRPSNDGLGSLLTLDPDGVDKSLRWQAQDAMVRPRRDVSPQGRQAEETLDVDVAGDAMVVDQAALPGLPADVAMRPVWQRLAVATAGMTLVAANWVVRRRQRRTAIRAAR